MIISKGIGIDLGTTNSAVAMMDLSDKSLILADDERKRSTMPSAVAFHPREKKLVVGMEAFQRRGMLKGAPILSIKRMMGYPGVVSLNDEEMDPPHVSSLILEAIKRRMDEKLRREYPNMTFLTDRAVITFPARFKQPSIEATKEAGRLAGFEVLELCHEPTAAAIYYCWKFGISDGAFMVVDLGGGTFDVSILKRVAGEFTVSGTGGDEHLGGDDFDRLLANYLLEDLQSIYDLSDFDQNGGPEDRSAFEKLTNCAEGVKKMLTDDFEVMLNNQNLFTDRSGENVILDRSITRDVFDDLIRSKANRIVECCDSALEDAYVRAGVTLDQIDHILLVGGSCRVPLIQETVRKAFCTGDDGRPRARCEAPILDEPDTCVALGAAIRAAAIGGLILYDDERRAKLTLHDVGGTDRVTYTLSGSVESLSPEVDLTDGMIRLTGSGSDQFSADMSQEAMLNHELAFMFRNLPLRSGSINNFNLELIDRDGNSIARFNRSIDQNDEHRDIGGFTSTSVLARPILLGIVERGRWTRFQLFNVGDSLPAKKSYTFFTTDQSGLVILPLYEQHRVIKTIEIPVPTTLDIGAPVLIEVECDEMYYLMVQGEVAGESFTARVEPPPPPPIPAPEEVNALKSKFEEQLAYESKDDQMALRGKFRRLVSDIDEAMRNQDAPKLIERVSELEALVQEMGRKITLEPAWDLFEQMASKCDRIVDLAGEMLSGFNAKEGHEHVETQLKYAKAAYDSQDQQLYGERYVNLSQYHDYLRQRLEERITPPPTQTEEEQARQFIEELRQMIAELSDLALAKENMVIVSALQGLMRQLDYEERRCQDVPQVVIRQCRRMYAEIQRLEGQIQGQKTSGEDTKGGVAAG